MDPKASQPPNATPTKATAKPSQRGDGEAEPDGGVGAEPPHRGVWGVVPPQRTTRDEACAFRRQASPERVGAVGFEPTTFRL